MGKQDNRLADWAEGLIDHIVAPKIIIIYSKLSKMAAGEVVGPQKPKTVNFKDGNDISNSLSDFTCPICLQVLIEPVIMPCEHELCGPCFKKNVEEANFLCPLCRMRISSWARRNSRNGTLVNSKRWEQIQKLFPENCRKRLRGEDDDDLFGWYLRLCGYVILTRISYENVVESF